MRDKLMQKNHWDKMFRYYDDKIPWIDELVQETISEQGDDSIGANRAYSLQFSSYMGYMNTLYSSGSSLEEIKTLYPKLVDIFKNVWDKSSEYVQMVWLLSIGIMLDVDESYIAELSELAKRDNLDDFLINFLIHHNMPSWSFEGDEFQFDEPYSGLLRVIQSTNNNDASELLRNYIERKWYSGHKEMGWYDMHKDKNILYHGYWSYESGVIAKILNLDDAGWDSMKYYPYDMVRYHS